jgi:hypothetical protein
VASFEYGFDTIMYKYYVSHIEKARDI